MKKIILFILVLTSFVSANAQSYLGYYHDNYAGVQGVLFNPASIVDSRFKTDINIFSISTAVGNDLYGVKLFDVYKDNYDFDKEAKRTPKLSNNAIVNLDFMGPSFMFNIAPKHSLAVFTRVRSIANIVQINGNLVDEVKEGLDKSNNFNFNGGSPNVVSNSWGELGLSYAAVLFQKNQHFLKGGLTAKYLQGGVNGYIQAKGLDVAFVENTTDPKQSTLATTGTLTVGGSQDFEANSDVEFDAKSRGVGFDFGFVYEWRPDFEKYDLNNAKPVDNNFRDLNKYKLRFGLSVTDIGSINYKDATRDTYNLTGVVTQDMVDSADDLYDFLNQHYTKTSENKGLRTKLPTALHADVDWNMHKKFYLNLNGDISMVKNTKLNGNSIADRISLTPRYESKWFSFYVPMTWMEYSGAQVGTGLRFGALFVGSSSVITNLVSNQSKAIDFHLGIKIPVYQKKFKDRDEDGVIDKVDGCKKVAGPAENNGCPWPDTDGDSVFDKDDVCINVVGPVENKGCPWEDTDGDSLLDNVDNCPKIAGPVENNGCPWPDSDGDGVLDKDDKCISEAGPAENNGCPWADTDGDGVLDKDDKCPSVKGTVANNGCPVIDEKVMKTLNDFSRSILFNSGKATIREESYVNLDGIVAVIGEFESAKFKLEGYTDNTGSKTKNLQLSKDRALAVKEYLISKGISADRLSSDGFGILKPIGDNKTPNGRTLNRRVEIILVK